MGDSATLVRMIGNRGGSGGRTINKDRDRNGEQGRDRIKIQGAGSLAGGLRGVGGTAAGAGGIVAGSQVTHTGSVLLQTGSVFVGDSKNRH